MLAEGTYSAQPSCRQSAVAPASCCPVRRAEDQYLEVLVLVVCGRRSFEAWRWHRKSDIENQAALVELGQPSIRGGS